MKSLCLLLILSISHNAIATETDQFTYSDVSIPDSQNELNQVLNAILDESLVRANKELAARSPGMSVSNEVVETAFATGYYKTMYKTLSDKILSRFEKCIDYRGCQGWPRIERILLKPGESVYGLSKLSYVSRKFVAATVQTCGVRMGTDKLTHMFNDGFFFYNASRNKSSGLTQKDQIEELMIYDEEHLMGGAFTKVISYGDTLANLSGLQYFRDLFDPADPVLVRTQSGQIVRVRNVEICEYIVPEMSETVLRPSYTVKAKKIRRLAEAIQRRLKEAEARTQNFSPLEREAFDQKILSREMVFDPMKFPAQVYYGAKVAWFYVTKGKKFRKALRIQLSPDFLAEDRSPIAMNTIDDCDVPTDIAQR